MFKVDTVDNLYTVYSILREQYPSQEIDITYNWNNKQYYVKVTDRIFKEDPDVPVDLKIEVVYGDSVTFDTPIILRNPKTNKITIKNIDSISKNWDSYPHFKILDTSVRISKEYALTDYEVWSDLGWSPIKKIIRHKTEKELYRVETSIGSIDVTEDHSLLLDNLDKITPSELKIGDSILHSFPTYPTSINTDSFIEKDSLSTVYKKTEYIHLQNINIPDVIINSSEQIKKLYIKDLLKISSFQSIIIYNKLQAQKLYYILLSIGYNINIMSISNTNTFILNNSDQLFDACKIKNIYKLEKSNLSEYVYDIETESGRFSAGIGEIIAKNTDSVFLRFKYNRDDFDKNRTDTFRLATICGDKLTHDIFKRPPIEMEFEKVFQPFILLTKKRYIAQKFDNMKDPFQLKGLDAKGIALTRRDYCKMVKDCYRNVIDTIMDTDDLDSVDKSINLFKSYIDKIHNYKIEIDDIIISAQIGKEYSCKKCKKKCEWILKCPNKKCNTLNPQQYDKCIKCKREFECVHNFSLAHINLAQRLLTRNEEVCVGDRIAFIFVETDNKKAQKSELAEDPIYANKNNLKFNRTCYLEQLAKPLLGFYRIVLKEDSDKLDKLIDYVNSKLLEYGGSKLKASDYKFED